MVLTRHIIPSGSLEILLFIRHLGEPPLSIRNHCVFTIQLVESLLFCAKTTLLSEFRMNVVTHYYDLYIYIVQVFFSSAKGGSSCQIYFMTLNKPGMANW